MRPIQTARAFGWAVRRARKERGLSQAELAAMAGVGRPWLSELENGKQTAELGRALAVLSAMDLAVIVESPPVDDAVIDLSRLLAKEHP